MATRKKAKTKTGAARVKAPAKVKARPKAKAKPKRAKTKAKAKPKSKTRSTAKSGALVVEGALASHAAGLKSRDGSWTLAFSLMPWQRVDTGAVDDRPLRVQVPGMSKATLQRHMQRLHTGTTVRVDVGEIQERPGNPLGVAKTPIRETKGSPALAAARAERDKPVQLKHPKLGALLLNREYNWFEGTWKSGPCELCVEQSDETQDLAADTRDIENAAKRLARVEKLMPAIGRALTAKLLPLYNDNWRQDRPKLTAAEFSKHLKLSSVVVHRSERITIYYRPTELFFDHGPEVRVKNGKISEVLIS